MRIQQVKMVLGGPPQSGKSCLREGLKVALNRKRRRCPGVPYPFVITACPDGEGAWFSEAWRRSPENARELKTAYKSEHTDEFVARVAEWVAECTEPLTIVDVGGKVSEENRRICKNATHIVILAGRTDALDPRMNEWREFAKELELTIIAEAVSDYHGTKDRIEPIGEDRILRGSVHRLDRSEDMSERPMVRKLAEHVLEFCLEIPTSEAGYDTMKEVYKIDRDKDLLSVGFGAEAQNAAIVTAATARLEQMDKAGELKGGGLLKVNGPASLPVAMVLAHKLAHLFEAIAWFDPKVNKYVVAISHSPSYPVGTWIA